MPSAVSRGPASMGSPVEAIRTGLPAHHKKLATATVTVTVTVSHSHSHSHNPSHSHSQQQRTSQFEHALDSRPTGKLKLATVGDHVPRLTSNTKGGAGNQAEAEEERGTRF